MVGMGHGRGQHQTVEIGGRRDGRVEAYRLTVLQDGGAYPPMGPVLPFLTRMMAPGTYDLARVDVAARSVATNPTRTVAYTGAGRPAATATNQRADAETAVAGRRTSGRLCLGGSQNIKTKK